MIYCEFYVELFYIHSKHTQLSTAGAQYIVSGSWTHKLSFHACKGNRKWTKYWNFRCWCHVQIFRYMNSIYFILIFYYAAFKLPTDFRFPIKCFYISRMAVLRIAKCIFYLLLNLNIDYSIDFNTEMLWFAKKRCFCGTWSKWGEYNHLIGEMIWLH